MFHYICLAFVAFPDRKDSLFKANAGKVVAHSSGSLGFYRYGKCQQTYPNNTLTSDPNIDWCSNIGTKDQSPPWISYSIQGKKMKLTGYSMRNGCCRFIDCCCIDDNTKVDSRVYCCCALYSYLVQGSNDNATWVTIHKIEKKSEFYYCKYETYEFPETQYFNFVRILLTEEYPHCPYCMVINEIDLYGSTTDSYDFFEESDENEESVSIIGKVKRDE